MIFKELKPSCPSCLKGSHINKKSTSLGGGKVRTGRVHGYDPSRNRSKSREQQRSTSTSGEQRTSGRSQSRGRDKSLTRSQSTRSQSIGRSKSRERRSYNRTDTSNTGSAKPVRKKYEYDTPFDAKGRCHYHKNVQLASRKMTGGWKVLHAACPKCMEDKCGEDDDSTPITSVVKSTSTGGKTSSGGTAIQVAKRFSSRWKLATTSFFFRM